MPVAVVTAAIVARRNGGETSHEPILGGPAKAGSIVAMLRLAARPAPRSSRVGYGKLLRSTSCECSRHSDHSRDAAATQYREGHRMIEPS